MPYGWQGACARIRQTLEVGSARWTTLIRIPLPLPHMGSVNAWLLRGDPLTLIDTGPRDDEALTALEAGLATAGVRRRGHRARPRHPPPSRPQRTGHDDRRRSGARIGALDRAAAYGARLRRARRGRPALLARADAPPRRARSRDRRQRGLLGLHPRAVATPTTPTSCSPTADSIRAGGRDLRVVARPGHSTTDALLVDERERIAFVGDHLLGGISSNTEVYPALEPDGTRPRARVEYLAEPARTAAMPLARLLTGHGDDDHRPRGSRPRAAGTTTPPLRPHRRGARAAAAPARSRSPTHLWSPRTVSEQPLLVVWEVLGHLDLLLDAGRVDEHVTQDGSTVRRRVLRPRRTATTRP